MERNFRSCGITLTYTLNERLLSLNESRQTALCVGLDVSPERLPTELPRDINGAHTFIQNIIEATYQFAVAFKPNLAFYLQFGSEGLNLLSSVRQMVPSECLVIGDAKWGDIGNTSEVYARAGFDVLGFDAITLSPYPGTDAILPFIGDPQKGVFVLCKTSNPSAHEFQGNNTDSKLNPIFLQVAHKVEKLNTRGNCGLVVGATQHSGLDMVREIAPTTSTLVPGIGAQNGNLEDVVASLSKSPSTGLLINSSRSIIYATGDSSYQQNSKYVAQKLSEAIAEKLYR